MVIRKYNKYAEIPDSRLFSDRIPVFATQNYADYLKELKKHDTYWFAGIEDDKVTCFIPVAISERLIFKRAYFLTGVIILNPDKSPETEKEFLENVAEEIKKNKLCDWVQQGPNWALFNSVPADSISVKFGTYKLFLKDKCEEELYKLIKNTERGNINKALKSDIKIKKGTDYLSDCLKIVNSTAQDANLHPLTLKEAKKLIYHFKDKLKIYVSYSDGTPQSAAILLRNEYCTYGLYAGTIPNAFRGANAYLWWEAIKDAKLNNCEYFDFVGARVNPEPGTKLERIQRFKKHFGSEFIQGYLWIMVISGLKYKVYKNLLKFYFLVLNREMRKDIIEQELERQKKEELKVYRAISKIPDYEKFADTIPVFATQNYADYLKEFNNHDVYWFAEFEDNSLKFLLPIAIRKKHFFTKGYCLTGVVSFSKEINIEKEKEFLEKVIDYIREHKLCDWIRQGVNWAVFNTYPEHSDAVPYGTYRIFLKDKNENDLFRQIHKSQRRYINKAAKGSVQVKRNIEYLNDCIAILDVTAKKANIHSPSFIEVKKLLYHCKDNLKIYVAYYNDVPQCAAIFITNKYCTYGLYAGRIEESIHGSNAYLDWEVIKDSKNNNCDYFDFVGGRINPKPGSKMEGIQNYKRSFGCEFAQGYLWKMVISKGKFKVYSILLNMYFLILRKNRKKDIIDQELENQKDEIIYTDN